jgi:nitrogen fixation protein NifU and related proteins
MCRFSEILMDHFNSPRNSGRTETPDRVGIAGTPGRGPYVALYLRLAGDVISEAQFQTHGCGVSIACGSMLTEMIVQRAADECLKLTPERLSEALDGVPGTKLRRRTLALTAGYSLRLRIIYTIQPWLSFRDFREQSIID